MKKNNFSRLSLKFILIFLFLLFVVYFILGSIFLIAERNRIYKQFLIDNESVINRLAFNLISPIWYVDHEVMIRLINYESSNSNIYAIAIYDEGGTFIVGGVRGNESSIAKIEDIKKIENPNSKKYVDIREKEILKDDDVIGVVKVFFSDKVLKKQLGYSTLKIFIQLLFLSLSIIFIVAITFRKLILWNFKKIFTVIQTLSTGDITKEIDVKSDDEIGDLALNINNFTGILNNMITIIKNAFEKNIVLSTKITANSEEIASTSGEIEMSMMNIKERTQFLGKNINSVEELLFFVNDNMNNLHAKTINQNDLIRVSADNIKNTIDLIQKLYTIGNENKSLIDNLSKNAFNSEKEMANTLKSIDNISGFTAIIVDMITVINDISEKIKLLSMNAAIEASHAGESGKGFAVVAKEIRRLSETTQTNTSNISNSLKNIMERIKDANSVANNTAVSIKNMIMSVKSVSDNLYNINKLLNDIMNNNNTIQSSLDNIELTNSEVSSIFNDMLKNYNIVKNQYSEVMNISKENLKSITNVYICLSEVNKSLGDIASENSENSDVIKLLENELNFFKIK